MRGNNWDRIIDIINFTNSDSIDKEQVKGMLAFDKTWDFTVIDSLFFRKIISIEDYKFYLEEYIKRLNDESKSCAEYLKEAEEKGEEYNPYCHYGFNKPFFGNVIDTMKNR